MAAAPAMDANEAQEWNSTAGPEQFSNASFSAAPAMQEAQEQYPVAVGPPSRNAPAPYFQDAVTVQGLRPALRTPGSFIPRPSSAPPARFEGEGSPLLGGEASPVRFFHDHATYTGVHRHGGPSTNDTGISMNTASTRKFYEDSLRPNLRIGPESAHLKVGSAPKNLIESAPYWRDTGGVNHASAQAHYPSTLRPGLRSGSNVMRAGSPSGAWQMAGSLGDSSPTVRSASAPPTVRGAVGVRNGGDESPQRFYDAGTYTGVHKHGGPSTNDVGIAMNPASTRQFYENSLRPQLRHGPESTHLKVGPAPKNLIAPAPFWTDTGGVNHACAQANYPSTLRPGLRSGSNIMRTSEPSKVWSPSPTFLRPSSAPPTVRGAVGARRGEAAGGEESPDRFYHETATYTGVHRNGGPSTNDVGIAMNTAATRTFYVDSLRPNLRHHECQATHLKVGPAPKNLIEPAPFWRDTGGLNHACAQSNYPRTLRPGLRSGGTVMRVGSPNRWSSTRASELSGPSLRGPCSQVQGKRRRPSSAPIHGRGSHRGSRTACADGARSGQPSRWLRRGGILHATPTQQQESTTPAPVAPAPAAPAPEPPAPAATDMPTASPPPPSSVPPEPLMSAPPVRPAGAQAADEATVGADAASAPPAPATPPPPTSKPTSSRPAGVGVRASAEDIQTRRERPASANARGRPSSGAAVRPAPRRPAARPPSARRNAN